MNGYKVLLIAALCLFGFCTVHSHLAPNRRHRTAANKDPKVYLIHADQLRYDMYGDNPDAQIVKGSVSFRHQGATLTCDSAYFYQDDNVVKAFGHVRLRQADTLSLACDYADYDGENQMMIARRNVILRHRRQVLYTDSLDYDRLYGIVNFHEGGTLVDGKDKLTSDWGEYSVDTRQAVFYYNVRLQGNDRLITTDTLYYDTRKSLAHVVGPSKLESKTNTINTTHGYFDTRGNKAELFGRSTVEDKDKSITGDSLYYDKDSGISRGYGSVVYKNTDGSQSLEGDEFMYNEKTGAGFATKRALAKYFSKKDTLFVHADSLKIYSYHMDTDSVYRKIHAYHKVSAYRQDVQAICDSLVFNTKDSCMTMYHDPIIWNEGRQLLGEYIKVYMNDSTIRYAHVVGQALSVEKVQGEDRFNQVSSREMSAYFENGKLQQSDAIGNVKSLYYVIDDKDSTYIGLNYLETDTIRMFLNKEQKLDRIWTNKFTATMYPMTQIPPSRYKLPGYAWYNELRPKDKTDIFNWRGKSEDAKLKVFQRKEAPQQTLSRQSR